MEKDQMVIPRNIARFMTCGCGLVEGLDENNPDYIWVRWVGESEKRKEHIAELLEI